MSLPSPAGVYGLEFGGESLAQSAGLEPRADTSPPIGEGGGVARPSRGSHLSPCRLPLLVAPVSKGLLRLRQITGHPLKWSALC